MLFDQFLDEKEGISTTAYRDGSGIWTICRGATRVDGQSVVKGMKLMQEKCDQVNAIELDNIGPGKCSPSSSISALMPVAIAFIAGNVWSSRNWEKKWADRDSAESS